MDHFNPDHLPAQPAVWKPGFTIESFNPEGGYENPIIGSNASPGVPIEAELVVPPPDQVSQNESLKCLGVLRMQMPDMDKYSAHGSFVEIFIDVRGEDGELLASHQPILSGDFNTKACWPRIFTDRPEDAQFVYFPITDVKFPHPGKFVLNLGVTVQVLFEVGPNSHFRMYPPPEHEYLDGKRYTGNGKSGYVAGILTPTVHVEVKAESVVERVERRNPLTPDQMKLVDMCQRTLPLISPELMRETDTYNIKEIDGSQATRNGSAMDG
ncbi:hypothetical protein QBC45DRAFT_442606 [Copromyces sp. CBS 386.78]|nr:hypothetical protein QBC45DRAFT_442606 [Copromyces sp. CBS 386.78]